ncbi:tRNA modification GTPase [Eubacterium ruminantium]|nr:tRNA modification GTPase [Eubacterium ruminantium]
MSVKDTICAIATGGMGGSGIGIIRVSGEDAISICDKVFKGKKRISEMETYTAAFGNIVNRRAGDQVVDEAIALVMKAPHSYTTEDTVELDCHGNAFLLQKVLELLIAEGARIAEPGEFTKRAYMGGRIDMSEAEAVMDVINAEGNAALSASMNQLRGGLKKKIISLREKILYDTAYIESALDDPENYSLEGFLERLDKNVDEVRSEIDILLNTCEDGRLIKEGIRTAIVGKPNVGKSSILNMILEEDRAIVTNIEGTTRDTLEEYVRLKGVLLKLIDTAGIRDTEDLVERIGVEKACENIEKADLVLFIADGARELDKNDEEIISHFADKTVITLINKEDLETVIDRERLEKLLAANGCVPRILTVSAAENTGREELSSLIKELFMKGEAVYNNQIIISNSRHKEALINADEALKRVKDSIAQMLPEDFYTIDLMAAYESLGLVIGETLEDDLADKIFAEFCMGK